MKKAKIKDTLESMSQAVWYNKWTLRKFEKFIHGEILEVGCGIGNFTNSLINYGDVWSIDISKEYVLKTEKLIGNRVNVGFGDIEKRKYFFGNQKFDNIICLNVLEHIQNDMTALKNMYDLLKNGGKLILLVPAHDFLFGEIDRSIGHFRRYEKQILIKKLEKMDYKIIRSWKFNFLGAVGWFISGKILKDTHGKKWKIRIFDLIARLVLPLEEIMEFPIGTSILIVAQKNGSSYRITSDCLI